MVMLSQKVPNQKRGGNDKSMRRTRRKKGKLLFKNKKLSFLKYLLIRKVKSIIGFDQPTRQYRRGIDPLSGKRTRSGWENEMIKLLSDLGIRYEYEPKRFYFKSEKESYLPDFYLPDYKVFIEVKGWYDERSQRRTKLFLKEYPQYGLVLYSEKDRKKCLRNKYQLLTLIQKAQVNGKSGELLTG
jgi:hypothetical protein